MQAASCLLTSPPRQANSERTGGLGGQTSSRGPYPARHSAGAWAAVYGAAVSQDMLASSRQTRVRLRQVQGDHPSRPPRASSETASLLPDARHARCQLPSGDKGGASSTKPAERVGGLTDHPQHRRFGPVRGRRFGRHRSWGPPAAVAAPSPRSVPPAGPPASPIITAPPPPVPDSPVPPEYALPGSECSDADGCIPAFRASCAGIVS